MTTDPPQPVPDPVPDVVTVHLWGVSHRHVPRAAVRMASDRRALRSVPGLRFAKLLGTGSGRTFTVRDADPRHWALLAAWESAAAAAAFERGRIVSGWASIAEERMRVAMRPLASRGRWSGRQPFGRPAPHSHGGSIAAVTRARIAPRKALRFWRAVPPVAADLHPSPGLRFAIGIGEAPVGLQGTFSIWESAAALTDFAYRRPAHSAAIRRTAEEGWYTEELFARFAVLSWEGRLTTPAERGD